MGVHSFSSHIAFAILLAFSYFCQASPSIAEQPAVWKYLQARTWTPSNAPPLENYHLAMATKTRVYLQKPVGSENRHLLHVFLFSLLSEEDQQHVEGFLAARNAQLPGKFLEPRQWQPRDKFDKLPTGTIGGVFGIPGFEMVHVHISNDDMRMIIRKKLSDADQIYVDDFLQAIAPPRSSEPQPLASDPSQFKEPVGELRSKFGSMRVWNDVSGKFQTEAKLLSTNEFEARLALKSGKNLSIGHAKLSEADREFLSEFLSAARPGTGREHPPELAASGTPPLMEKPTTPKAPLVTNDDGLVELVFPVKNLHGGDRVKKSFPKTIPWEVSNVAKVATGQLQNNSINVPNGNFFHIRLAKLAPVTIASGLSGELAICSPDDSAKPIYQASSQLKLQEISPNGKTAALLGYQDWKMSVALADIDGDRITPRYAFQPEVENLKTVKVVRLANADRLITVDVVSNLAIWDISNPEGPTTVVSFDNNSRTGEFRGFDISPGGELVALSWEDRIILIDTMTGRVRGAIDVGKGLGAPSFSPDGQRLAVGSNGEILIYGLSNRTIERRLPFWQTSPSQLSWLDSKHLIAHSVVYDIAVGLPFCVYPRFDHRSCGYGEYHGFFVDKEKYGKRSTFRLTKLPAPEALALANTKSQADLLALYPGAKVRLAYSLGNAPNAAGLKNVIAPQIHEICRTNQWQIDNNAATTLEVSIIPEPKTDTFVYLGGQKSAADAVRGFFGGDTSQRQEFTVTYNRWKHELKITSEGKQHYSKTHTPQLPTKLEQWFTESAQSAIQKKSQPEPDWFADVEPRATIFKIDPVNSLPQFSTKIKP